MVKNYELGAEFGFYGKMLRTLKDLTENTNLYEYMKSSVLKNIQREYLNLMSKGQKPLLMTLSGNEYMFGRWNSNSHRIIRTIRDKLQIPIGVIDYYSRVLFGLARTGQIKYKNLDPVGIQQSDQGVSEFSFWKKLTPGFNFMKLGLIAGGLIGGAVIFTKLKEK